MLRIIHMLSGVDEIRTDKGMRILVKLPNYVGDIIMCLPAVDALREVLPEEQGHELHFLTDDNYCDLLYGQKWHDEDKIIHPKWNPHKVKPKDVFEELRKVNKSYDMVISFTRQPRFLRGFKKAGIGIRAGYTSLETIYWLNKRVPEPTGAESASSAGQTNYYLELIKKSFKWECNNNEWIAGHPSRLYVDKSCRDEAVGIVRDSIIGRASSEISEQDGGGADFPKPYYVVAVGCSMTRQGTLKKWPLWHFVETTKLLHAVGAKSKLIPVFLFGPEEGQLYQTFQKRFAKELPMKAVAISPDKKMRLRHVMALVKESEFVLSNDSGLRHIATALKKKVVSIFGPTSINRSTYSSHLEFPVWVNVGCNLMDCKSHTCSEKNICMTTITPSLVYRDITNFIGEELYCS